MSPAMAGRTAAPLVAAAAFAHLPECYGTRRRLRQPEIPTCRDAPHPGQVPAPKEGGDGRSTDGRILSYANQPGWAYKNHQMTLELDFNEEFGASHLTPPNPGLNDHRRTGREFINSEVSEDSGPAQGETEAMFKIGPKSLITAGGLGPATLRTTAAMAVFAMVTAVPVADALGPGPLGLQGWDLPSAQASESHPFLGVYESVRTGEYGRGLPEVPFRDRTVALHDKQPEFTHPPAGRTRDNWRGAIARETPRGAGLLTDRASVEPAEFDYRVDEHTGPGFPAFGVPERPMQLLGRSSPDGAAGLKPRAHGNSRPSGAAVPADSTAFERRGEAGWPAGFPFTASLAVPNPGQSGGPVVSDSAFVNDFLVAITSGIKGANGPPLALTYQWVMVDGGTETDIPGARSMIYRVAPSDLGKAFRVRVSYQDRLGLPKGPFTSPVSRTVRAPLDYTRYESFDTFSDASGGVVGNDRPTGIWSDGQTMWVHDAGTASTWAYRLEEDPGTAATGDYGSRDPSKDIQLNNPDHLTVTADGTYLYFPEASRNGDARDIHVVRISDRSAEPGRDIDYCQPSRWPRFGVSGYPDVCSGAGWGASTDGEHIWLFNATNTLRALRLTDNPATDANEYGTRAPGADITFDEFNPHGSYTDGEFMWGSSPGERTVRAVRLSNETRASGREFRLAADNANPRGLWSNGVTFFVSDMDDGKLYTYRQRDNASGLSVQGTPVALETLTADTSGITDPNGLPDPVPNGFYSFQWQRNDGHGWKDILGETGPDYLLPPLLDSAKFRVRAVFADRAGYAEQMYSEPVDVAPLPFYLLGNGSLNDACRSGGPERCASTGPASTPRQEVETTYGWTPHRTPGGPSLRHLGTDRFAGERRGTVASGWHTWPKRGWTRAAGE